MQPGCKFKKVDCLTCCREGLSTYSYLGLWGSRKLGKITKHFTL